MSNARSSTRDDYDRVKDALQKLKTDNRKLRKEIGHLKKELLRVDNTHFDKTMGLEEEDTPEDLVLAPRETTDTPRCPACKSEDFKQILAGMYRITVCHACGYRKRLKAKG